jgi:c-di-GMP-binding flagellar brake protein YcgR
MAVGADSLVKIGQLVELRLRASEMLLNAGLHVEEESPGYSSHIEDVLPEIIVVSWPTDKGILVPATVGQGIRMIVRGERGRLQLSSQIAGKSHEPHPLLQIARAGKWSAAQLRRHVRLPITIHPRETLLVSQEGSIGTGMASNGPRADLSETEEGQPIKATIQDLSAGGVRLLSQTPLARQDIIKISFTLGEGQREIATRARVVWVREGDAAQRRQPTVAGCEFLDLGSKEQDSITRFIFAKQAELRRSGRL